MTENTAQTFCANHPTTPTSLRCSRCEKYICARCAVKTPVGYRCPECVKSQQKIFETAQWWDIPVGMIAAGVLSFAGSIVISLVGAIGFFGFILVAAIAPTAGVIISEAVRYVIQKRRSRSLFIAIAVAVGIGALPLLLINLFTMNFFGIAFQAIYLITCIPTVYTRLSGIQLFK